MKKHRTKEAGISLIEAMIAIAITATVFLMAAGNMARVSSAQASLSARLKARQILERSSAKLAASSANFPAVTVLNNSTYYVGCFSKLGQQMTNRRGVVDYEIIANQTPEEVSGFCKDAKFEVHLQPQAKGKAPGVAEVYLLMLDGDGQKQNLYKSSLKLESSL